MGRCCKWWFSGGSDTFIQYNNGGSFGATTLAFDDTAGSEQILLDDGDVALMKVVQRGTGSSFEVHDQASDSTVFQVSASGATSIGLGAGLAQAQIYCSYREGHRVRYGQHQQMAVHLLLCLLVGPI